MADVARLAGVSQQTVSRVLNGNPHVRAETRERVEDAVRKLDYRPNRVARALVTGRSRTLGVVSFDTTLFGPASTLSGIERAAHDAGYSVSIASLAELTAVAVHRAIDRLRDQGVDGVLVIAPQEAAARALHRLPPGLPVVATEAGTQDDVPLVAVDQRAGAEAVTGHLLALGHRTVWHVSGPPDWLEAQDRVRGWRDTLTAAGAPVPAVLEGDWSARSGYALARRPARRRDRGLRRQRPDGARGASRPSRARPPGARGGQRRRLRRHPGGGVLHAAADDGPPALRRGRPAGAAGAGGPARRRAPDRDADDDRPRARRPRQHRLAYGFVVESVNVSVLPYVPVRSASLAPIDCRNCSVTASLLIGPS